MKGDLAVRFRAVTAGTARHVSPRGADLVESALEAEAFSPRSFAASQRFAETAHFSCRAQSIVVSRIVHRSTSDVDRTRDHVVHSDKGHCGDSNGCSDPQSMESRDLRSIMGEWRVLSRNSDNRTQTTLDLERDSDSLSRERVLPAHGRNSASLESRYRTRPQHSFQDGQPLGADSQRPDPLAVQRIHAKLLHRHGHHARVP